jgi:hypothetical protein
MDENNNNFISPAPSHKKLKVLLGLLVLVVVCAGAYVYLYPLILKNIISTTPLVPPTEETKLAVDLTPSTDNKVPVAIPKDMISEKNVRVLDSYTAVTPKGVQQTTYRYVSNKSINDNAQYFSKYLQKNKWGYVTESKTPEYVFLSYSSQANGDLTVTINFNRSIPGTVVDITIQKLTTQ